MQHEGHRIPVTALTFFRRGIILAGEGNYLQVYSADHQALKRVRIFESQAVHGIVVDSSASIALVWGGPLVRELSLDLSEDGKVNISVGTVRNTGDWILDAALAPLIEAGMHRAALITAHNAVLVRDIISSSFTCEDSRSTVLERLTPGSNCILYSAHIKWLSLSRCLIACGTAFGDIIVWSVFLSERDGKLYAQNETHYKFSAHDGSVFGVHISPLLVLPNSKSTSRVLASCSDDRNIKLWDISDLATQSPTNLSQVGRETGFGGVVDDVGNAPSCLARTLGHISRIWHVRFGVGSDPALQELVSFGEDASMIMWAVKPNKNSSDSPYILEKTDAVMAHSGKNIWSVAVHDAGYFATGGADGAITLQSGMRGEHSILEIPSPNLEQSGNQDNFRAYCFVDTDVLVSTTEKGRIMLIDISCSDHKAVITEISAPLSGLRGYSIVSSLPGIAFIAGIDGCVFAYLSTSGRLLSVDNVNSKVAAIFTCQHSDSGVAILVTVVGATKARLLMMNYDSGTGATQMTEAIELSLPDGFVVTSFAFHNQASTRFALLGSRTSSLAFYKFLEGSSSGLLAPSRVYELVHGEEAVTALYWKVGSCTPSGKGGWLYSTGRDGTFAVHHTTVAHGDFGLSLVHQLQTPFGPNIEGIDVSPQGTLRIWGFKSKHFITYDIMNHKELITVECGGAHRKWAFQPGDSGGTFVWTKASKVYRKTQSMLPYELINQGCHGREIKSVSLSPNPNVLQIIATGAEDTDIKLFKLEQDDFKLLQTLRKHKTGIQCLKWSTDSRYLFSSGGFEEFFIWRVTSGIPYITVGVLCESTHPQSGTSDLRIMSFDVREELVNNEAEPDVCFTIAMAYSDSTFKLWRYANKTWDLLASADYLTSCMMQVFRVDGGALAFLTAATDGHITRWQLSRPLDSLYWTNRYKVHQSAIHIAATCALADNSILAVTGGDDNAIGLTRFCQGQQAAATTLRVPRAHAAAVTGLALVPVGDTSYWLASAGIDQRGNLWQVDIDPTQPGVEGIVIKPLQHVYTAVADVSSLEICRLEDGAMGALVCGVGMDLWRLPVLGPN